MSAKLMRSCCIQWGGQGHISGAVYSHNDNSSSKPSCWMMIRAKMSTPYLKDMPCEWHETHPRNSFCIGGTEITRLWSYLLGVFLHGLRNLLIYLYPWMVLCHQLNMGRAGEEPATSGGWKSCRADLTRYDQSSRTYCLCVVHLPLMWDEFVVDGFARSLSQGGWAFGTGKQVPGS